ncbi:MAG: CRTAC1 family protein [Bacteroidia bacterium]
MTYHRHLLPAAALLLSVVYSSGQVPGRSPDSIPFADITEAAGIVHEFLVYEGMFGGGICVFDMDNDGFEDLYLTSGMADDQLYRNQGDGTFRNVFEGSGLEVTKGFATQGVAGADVNRDGWVDLFVTTLTSRDTALDIPRARNLLFLNNGDGTFRDATEVYGLVPLYSFSTGGSFGDFNADGWPDLYVGNYFLAYEGELTYISDATIAGSHQTAEGYLLRNDGGQRFTDVYDDYGLTYRGFGFGGVFTDYDNDGDQDLLVNHDFGYKGHPSRLLENRYPRRSFRDMSEALEMDLKMNAMGAALGDFNEDGYLDYLVTNIRFNRFMLSQGPGKPFVNKTKDLGMNIVSISWGANLADLDNDGDLDIFVSNGDLNPNCVPMGNYYFENEGGALTDQSVASGLKDYGIGRGSVVFDLENDGDLDLLVVSQRPVKSHYPVPSVTRLYRNDAARGNWLRVALRGVAAESHGIGSRVIVVAGGRRMMREIDGGGSSHLSQNSTIAHFGLGAATEVDSLIVVWTGGKRQVLTQQPVNTLLTVVEAAGAPRRWPYYLAAGLLVLGGGLWWRKSATRRAGTSSR